jgi:preprotein translocase subunit SecG
MPEFISNNLTAIVIALIGIFAGIAITIRYRKTSNKKTEDSSNKVIQSKNKVSGDQAGRDITKR